MKKMKKKMDGNSDMTRWVVREAEELGTMATIKTKEKARY